ncbi:MAG: ribose 5-phosphate isomerase B [Schleiferiaceae bacterium]|nr:ribose 5-phosphate isomerase B [Schleiferiaceae bacterium]
MNKILTVSIGNDHAGPELKFKIIEILENKGIKVINHGCDTSESVDYPDFAHAVAEDISIGKSDRGIVICGSGNGINMSVNKHNAIRSALCWNREIASLAVQHNDANVLALPARFISEEEAIACVLVFISEEFEGGRHQRRVDKIASC